MSPVARPWKASPTVITAVTLGALALSVAGAVLIDVRAHEFVTTNPMTANIVAALLLFPFEILVVSWIVTWWLDRQRQRQWQAVTNELAEAIGTRWTNLRELVMQRYGLAEFDESMAASAGRTGSGRASPTRKPGRSTGSRNCRRTVGTPASNRRVARQGFRIWSEMWGAGIDDEERALSTRLTKVLLPRLNPSEPELTSVVRRLVDASRT